VPEKADKRARHEADKLALEASLRQARANAERRGCEEVKAAGKPVLWKVVGGEDTGGIVVREGHELDSPKVGRFTTRSLVRQQAVKGVRMLCVLVTGSGPVHGWVTIKKASKELLVKISG